MSDQATLRMALVEVAASLTSMRSDLDWCIGYASSAESEVWASGLVSRLETLKTRLQLVAEDAATAAQE